MGLACYEPKPTVWLGVKNPMQSSTLGGGTMSSWAAPDDQSIVQKKPKSNSKRNTLACETCYKKKIKCEVDESSTGCIQCVRHNIPCKLTTRKERRDNLKRAHYVKNLEERLRKTKLVLQAAGILNEETIKQYDLSDDEDELLGDDSELEDEQEDCPPNGSPNESRRRGNFTTWGSHPPSDPNTSSKLYGRKHSEIKDGTHDSIVRINDKDDCRYFGRASSLSILSREGIEWIKSKTGEAKFLRLLVSDSKHDGPWNYWRPDVFHDLFASKVFKPLPPRAEVFSLFWDYFRSINLILPIYHEQTFMQMIEWQYTQQKCDDAARWASINIIMALAYEYRLTNNVRPERDRDRAWLYFKNAMSVFPELTLRRTDLLSTQALLGMAIFLRGNSGTQSALPIATAALRACHRMGLHRNIPRPHLSPVEQEQRKRVFWLAYMLDQSTCIRTGNAPGQHPDDFDVDYPKEDLENDISLDNKTTYFNQFCRLYVIKSRLYNRLYATNALKDKSPAEIFEIVKQLNAELEEWRNANPFSLETKQKTASEDFLAQFAYSSQQFVYFNALIMLHRLPLAIHFAYMQHLKGNKGSISFDARLIISESSISKGICAQAARDTLTLVNNLPWRDIAWIWSTLYYVFMAVVTVFVNILRDTRHPKAKEDLQALSMAATFFSTLIPGDGPCNHATFMTKMCSNFEQVARAVLENDQKAIRLSEKHASSKGHTTTTGSSSSTQAHQHQQRQRQQEGSVPPSTHIPDLPGLPRVNSSGYVVIPDSSPDPSDALSSTSNVTYPLTNPITLQTTTATPPTEPIQPQDTSRAYNNSLMNSNTTNLNPYTLENFFPTPIPDSFPQVDLWQVPFQAEWELSNQAQFNFSNLFPPGVYYPPESEPLSTTTTAAAPTTTAPSSIDMGFGYGNGQNNPYQDPASGGNPNTDNRRWTGGSFLGPF